MSINEPDPSGDPIATNEPADIIPPYAMSSMNRVVSLIALISLEAMITAVSSDEPCDANAKKSHDRGG